MSCCSIYKRVDHGSHGLLIPKGVLCRRESGKLFNQVQPFPAPFTAGGASFAGMQPALGALCPVVAVLMFLIILSSKLCFVKEVW